MDDDDDDDDYCFRPIITIVLNTSFLISRFIGAA